ncbi:GatB/YqeY domain-containing protein [Roseibium sediminicola]|uniref:GatB/YqeY domain-containing protein n=1 Tax=Roseibium sediminicola TaxID=2933272 RepID=A0ABT0GT94_9HYPH|nr:GatB/YqeY domain-containing protein [Roseibium sp. CAU 1639]MCK7612666.1 GatB/YqeY domain-containing protein [Roseibium sp. CAU 1639]
MRDRINAALKVAQDDGDKRRCATLRLVQTAVKDREAAARENGKDGVDEIEVIEILQTMISQRETSAVEFESGGQLDLAEQERTEQDIIREFLPVQLNEDEMRSICEETVRDIDAHGLRDIGRCMSELKTRYPGQMDFVQASCVVKDMLRADAKAGNGTDDGDGS